MGEKKKKKNKSNWLNKGGSSLSRMERSPEAGGQLAWCDQWVRNHYWLCPLASSPSGYMRATRVPMSPVDMTTSRVIEGPCPLRSFSWEPPLCSPSEDFPSLFPWPEPGHVSLLSQCHGGDCLGTEGVGRQPSRLEGSHSLIVRACGIYLWMELRNERDFGMSRASEVRCEEIRLPRMGFQTPRPL